MSLPPILNRALKAAYEGANEIIHFSKRIDNLEVTKKGENDVTTNLDKYVENIVKHSLLSFDSLARTLLRMTSFVMEGSRPVALWEFAR